MILVAIAAFPGALATAGTLLGIGQFLTTVSDSIAPWLHQNKVFAAAYHHLGENDHAALRFMEAITEEYFQEENAFVREVPWGQYVLKIRPNEERALHALGPESQAIFVHGLLVRERIVAELLRQEAEARADSSNEET